MSRSRWLISLRSFRCEPAARIVAIVAIAGLGFASAPPASAQKIERSMSVPTSHTEQSDKSGAPAQAGGYEEVTCFAGCVGRAGEVLSRRKVPPPAPETVADTRPRWRQRGHNLWCHEDYGCRSYNVVPYRPRYYCNRRSVAVYHVHVHY